MGDYYGVQGGAGGGGSEGTDQYMSFGQIKGASSYPTGGFVEDFTGTYSSINSARLSLEEAGTNMPWDWDIVPNSPTAGKVTIKLYKYRYDKTTAIGNIDTKPSGVTVRGTSGGTSSSEAAHIHSTTHDHASQISSTPTAAGAAAASGAIAAVMSTHTHAVDIPSLTINSGAGTSHNHTDNTLYTHNHATTMTETDLTLTELANATNVSTTFWRIRLFGVKA